MDGAADACVLVDDRFNEHLGELDMELADGNRVTLAIPFLSCG